VYSGTCGATVIAACDNTVGAGASVAFTATAGTTYLLRVGSPPATPPGPFVLTLDCPLPPVNDACAGATALGRGVNPAPPAGVSGTFFSNVGAFDDAGASCATHASDVWFTYVAIGSGPATFSTNTPPGFVAGSLTDTVLAVFDVCGGLQLSCDDNSGDGALSQATVNLVSGTSYRVRVGSRGPGEGTFYVTVKQDFALKAESPAGAGSVLLRHENGMPGAPFITIITLNQGAFPNGWLLGIDPTLNEVFLQIANPVPPFFGVLSASGTSSYGPALGLPPFTFYAGSAEFTPLLTISRISPPVGYTIP
jgi:hypothetical protein